MARKKQDIPEETPHDSQTDLNEMVDSVIQAEVASSDNNQETQQEDSICLLYTSPSPRDRG